MKILLIHNYYQYRGGEETYFESLAKLLKKNNHEVIIYIKNNQDIKKGYLNRLKIGLRMFKNYEVEKELSQIIIQHKPDLIHFNNIYPLITPTAYRICKKFKIPIVQTIHNYRFMCPKGIMFRNGKICELCAKKSLPLYGIIFSCYHSSFFASMIFSLSFLYHKLIGTFNYIDKFIFPSQFTRNYYLDNFGLSKDKTQILPHFVEQKIDMKEAKKSQKKQFIFIGRLSEEKGILPLLEVFKSLPKLKLLVIGDGPLRKEVKKFKRYKNIEIKGFLTHQEISKTIKHVFAVIVSSIWYEVLPFVYLESLQNNITIIVPHNKNFQLIVNKTKSSNVFFYKFNDFDDLKKTITQIVEGKNMKSINTDHKFPEMYSEKNHYKTLYQVYSQLLKR